MALSEKVARLKMEADRARRIVDFWERGIKELGEAKATGFYKSLGLNHLDVKATVEWEGLTLSREPTEVEKLCVKSISSAQDAGKASVSAVLLKARTELIDDGLKAIKKLEPANYHELVLTVPDKSKNELRDQLDKVFMKGKALVGVELAQQKKDASTGFFAKQAEPTDDDDAELDDLTDLTDSRVANEVQSRVTGAAARYALLGLTGAALWKAVRDELNTGSISYIDRASQGVANRVLNFGRSREMEDRADEIGNYEYSALLDSNTCPPCADDDGKEASSPDDLPDTPNPDCDGSDYCRCFIVAIAEGVM